ncbi:MAG: hypothetical protein ACXVPQ_11875, partial [Bacteroidia bacterium]
MRLPLGGYSLLTSEEQYKINDNSQHDQAQERAASDVQFRKIIGKNKQQHIRAGEHVQPAGKKNRPVYCCNRFHLNLSRNFDFIDELLY